MYSANRKFLLGGLGPNYARSLAPPRQEGIPPSFVSIERPGANGKCWSPPGHEINWCRPIRIGSTFRNIAFWILERREVMSGPSAVISQVPLELSDEEIKQGLLEGSKSLLEPQVSEMMKAVHVQRLKRREMSNDDSNQSRWVPRKSVRVIFPADELRQKFLGLGGIYLFWQYVPIREYVPPTYYCSICKNRGGHSTQYHRGPAPTGP